MKFSYLFLFFAFSIFLRHQSAFSQTADQLELAYKENSRAQLKTFLDSWATDVKPASDEEIAKMNKLVQQAYGVFETFYNPHDLKTRGGSQFGNDAYLPFNYFIISPTLRIYTADKVYFTDEEIRTYTIAEIKKRVKSDSLKIEFIKRYDTGQNDQLIEYWGPYGLVYPDTLEKLVQSVVNFRPRVTQTSGTMLYLHDKYHKALTDFLGNSNIPFGQNGPAQIGQAIGESKSKMMFLGNFVKIYLSHWGNSWDLQTPPIVSKMTFDKNLKYVKVDFTMVYEGGSAFLGFENGKWNLISAKRAWIE
ncbi:MAG TPA: hypothetical protein VKB19_16485 [Pedobacter sp.]|nr:hypothetical protein [Pedobacter sp.]